MKMITPIVVSDMAGNLRLMADRFNPWAKRRRLRSAPSFYALSPSETRWTKAQIGRTLPTHRLFRSAPI